MRTFLGMKATKVSSRRTHQTRTMAPSDRRRARPQAGGKRKQATLSVKTILVPLDFSDESRKALAYAAPFARQFGAEIVLLHVVEPVATPDFAKSFPLALDNEKLMNAARDQLDHISRLEGVRGKTLVRYGRSFQEIAGAARGLKADLIILSTHGYTGLKHVLLGSTTERVVRHAPCPVLVVRAGK